MADDVAPDGVVTLSNLSIKLGKTVSFESGNCIQTSGFAAFSLDFLKSGPSWTINELFTF